MEMTEVKELIETYHRAGKMEQIKLPLEQLVYSEGALCELLGIDKKTLDTLRRDRGFPAIRLTSRHRCYLTGDILEWLEKHRAVSE